MSWLEVRDDLSLSEYICLLADAFDSEELEGLRDHNMIMGIALAFNKPKKLKKWKFTSIDKAGTSPVYKGEQNVAAGLASMAVTLAKGQIQASPNTYIIERAKATGRRIIYMDEYGNYFHEDGSEANREPMDRVIRMFLDGVRH